jgi:hypothetical protein
VLGGTDRNSENPQDCWCLSRGVNPGSPEYKAVADTARPHVQVCGTLGVNTRPPFGFIVCEFVLFITMSSCFSNTDFNIILLFC